MTERPIESVRHRVIALVADLHGVLDADGDAAVWMLGADETAVALDEVARLRARVCELEARLLAHAGRVDAAALDGSASTDAWWAHRTRSTRPASRRAVRLAEALDAGCGRVRDGLASGSVNAEQALVIVDAVAALPADLAADLRDRAEEVLVGYAADFDATRLRLLGARILEVVAPEIAEAHEARLLEEAEARAAAATRLTMSEDGQGSVRGRFTIPVLHGAMLRKALCAIAHAGQGEPGGEKPSGGGQEQGGPREVGAAHSAPEQAGHHGVEPERTGAPQPQPQPQPQRRPTAERLGQALCELLERLPADRLPTSGGVSATVVVTMGLDTLTGRLAAASLDTGERLSAGAARRLACAARIIPAVLGGASQVLDVGRASRLFRGPQRIALALRDGGCTAVGCDRPPGWCDAHHDQRWTDGGATDLGNGRLLCPHHHRRAHDPTYRLEHRADGKVAFHRRT